MRGDQPRLWAQAVERAEKAIDRIDIGDGSGGFMEPSVSVHVGTVMWVERIVEKARLFADNDIMSDEDAYWRAHAALLKALELDLVVGEPE